MSLRAELRRQQKEDAKTIRETDKLAEVARRFGVKFDELATWKKREREIMASEIRNSVAAEYMKVANAMVDDYNTKLEMQKNEYNRLLDLREERAIEELTAEFSERLNQAENLCCLVNILITCLALNKTWGYKKGIEKFMQHWDAALDEIEEAGVKAVLEKVNGFGLDFEFDTFEIEDFIKACGEMDVKGVMKYLDYDKAKAG